MCLAIYYEHLSRSKPRIVVISHAEPISSCIAEHQYISLSNLIQLSIPAKGIRFTNITYYSINSFSSFRIANIGNSVIGFIQHRSNQVIQATVNACKYGAGSLLYNIGLNHKKARFTHQKLSRFEP